MKFKFRHAVIALCLFYSSCASVKTTSRVSDTLPALSLQPYGRYLYSKENTLELISSASNFGFSFIGKECRVFTYITDEAGHNYLQYELDGVYQKKIKISGNSREPLIITAATGGAHTVWTYKATEAHTGPIFIEKVKGDGLQSLKKPDAPFIEFIGNSITCGAAADPSEVPCGTGVYHDQHNAYYAYGPRVARALSANFMLSSVSGIGIYRNWNSDGPTMPQVYEKADFQELGSRLWNFNNYKPNIVSIALGTNDFSNGDGKHERLPFDSASFVSNYINFVKLIKAKYPGTQIALLSSVMVGGDRIIKLQHCLTAVKQNIDALYPSGRPVALYFVKPMRARGCGGHPSIEDHGLLADELIPFFKKLL